MLRASFTLIIMMMMNKLRTALLVKSIININKWTYSKRSLDSSRLYSMSKNSNTKIKSKIIFVLGGLYIDYISYCISYYYVLYLLVN